MIVKILYGLGIILALMLVVGSVMFYRVARQSETLLNAGIENGQLQSCPARPSCVSSLATNDEHSIAGFIVPQGMIDPVGEMAAIIVNMPRTEILEQNDVYLHATFGSAIFGFVDDLEILKDGEQLQVRSVSRVGYSDMGVNRKRVNALHDYWQQVLH